MLVTCENPSVLSCMTNCLLHWGYKNPFNCLQMYGLTLCSSWMCFRIKTSNLFIMAANVEFAGSPCLMFAEKVLL